MLGEGASRRSSARTNGSRPSPSARACVRMRRPRVPAAPLQTRSSPKPCRPKAARALAVDLTPSGDRRPVRLNNLTGIERILTADTAKPDCAPVGPRIQIRWGYPTGATGRSLSGEAGGDRSPRLTDCVKPAAKFRESLVDRHLCGGGAKRRWMNEGGPGSGRDGRRDAGDKLSLADARAAGAPPVGFPRSGTAHSNGRCCRTVCGSSVVWSRIEMRSPGGAL